MFGRTRTGIALVCWLVAGCGRDATTSQAPPPPPSMPPPPSAPTTVPPPTAPPPTTSLTPGQTTTPSTNNNPTLQIPGFPGLQLPFPTQGGNTGGTAATSTPSGPLAPAPPGTYDTTGAMTAMSIRADARSAFGELVAALQQRERDRILGIPLSVVEDMNEPNAAAGCRRGESYMLITSALLTIAAATSEAKAYDEVAGATSDRYEQYSREVANRVRQRQPVIPIPPGFLPGPLALDPRKLARQRFLYQQHVGFVLAHELGHHYRGHTGCANGARGAQAGPEDLARVVSNTMPMFTQPLEVEADIWAVHNVLDAGRARQGGHWSEEGGLLSLDFFGRLRNLGVDNVLLSIFRTHPLPQVRRPIVQTAAQQWRQGVRPPDWGALVGGQTGGTQGSSGQSPFPIPLPIPIPGLGGGGGGTR